MGKKKMKISESAKVNQESSIFENIKTNGNHID